MRPDRFGQGRGREFMESRGREREHPFPRTSDTPCLRVVFQPAGYRAYWPVVSPTELTDAVAELASRRPRWYRTRRYIIEGLNSFNEQPARYEETRTFPGPQRVPNNTALLAVGFPLAEANLKVTESNTPTVTVIESTNFASGAFIGTQSGTVVTENSITRVGTVGTITVTLEGEIVEFADYADAMYEALGRLSEFPIFGMDTYRLIGLPFYDDVPTEFTLGLELQQQGDFAFPGTCLIGGSEWDMRKTLVPPVLDHFSDWVVSRGGSGTRNQNTGGAIVPPNNISLSCVQSAGVEVLNPPPVDVVLDNIPVADDESPYSWEFYHYGFPQLPDPLIPGLVTCNVP